MNERTQPTFFEELKKGPIIGDGAMATLLHQSGVPVRTCFESLCIDQPDLVRDAHLAYLSAGSRLIQTNTFSGHRIGLQRYGLEDKVWEINRQAVKIAREAIEAYYEKLDKTQAREPVFVFGTIGSTADMIISPDLNNQGTRMSLRFLFEEQLAALLEESVDGILLETFPNLDELILAVETVRHLTDKPIIANLSPDAVGVTRDGYSIDEAFESLQSSGADIVGLNCRLGLSGILRTYENVSLNKEGFYSAVPNGGLLHLVEGDYSYTGNSDYFSEIGSQLVGMGVNFIGGCCGTTPDHIRSLAKKLDGGQIVPNRKAQSTAVNTKQKVVINHSTEAQEDMDDVVSTIGDGEHDLPSKDLLEQTKYETTVIIELDPPKVLEVDKYMQAAKVLQDAGADAITLADNSLGNVRVSNMAMASLLKKIGIEPLVHVACRDRNLIGQQSHLMGLHVLGIQNVLLVTGDPSRFGDLPGATSVFDVSSTELTRMVKKLNSGIAFSGQKLKQSSSFVVGTSFNPHVLNFNKALDRLRRKLEAGADYVMTQPIYDVHFFEKIARAVEEYDVPVFVGIMPMTSARNAQFLHNEVPGIEIPRSILDRMNHADPEQAANEGLRISEDLIREATQYFNGIYLVTPFLRYELTAHLTRFVKALNTKNKLHVIDRKKSNKNYG